MLPLSHKIPKFLPNWNENPAPFTVLAHSTYFGKLPKLLPTQLTNEHSPQLIIFNVYLHLIEILTTASPNSG